MRSLDLVHCWRSTVECAALITGAPVEIRSDVCVPEVRRAGDALPNDPG
jgi:hypothetical protein